LSPLAENRRGDIAKLGLKSLLGGTIATWMTARSPEFSQINSVRITQGSHYERQSEKI